MLAVSREEDVAEEGDAFAPLRNIFGAAIRHLDADRVVQSLVHRHSLGRVPHALACSSDYLLASSSIL